MAWYHHKGVFRKEANDLLHAAGKDGSFLVRDSASEPGIPVLSLLFSGKVTHYKILSGEKGLYIEGSDKSYRDLNELIDGYILLGNLNKLKCSLEYPIQVKSADSGESLWATSGPLNQQELFLHGIKVADIPFVKYYISQQSCELEKRNEDGWTALHWGCWLGHYVVVDLLLKGRANIHAKTNTLESPLMLASQRGHRGIIKTLLQYGADIEQKNAQGDTAFVLAISHGHTAAATCLIDYGADLWTVNSHGFSALHCVSENGQLEMVALLIQLGAEVNISNANGITPLMQAAGKGHAEVVKCLLQHGAVPTAIASGGRTAWSLATKYDHKEVMKILKQHLEKEIDRSHLPREQKDTQPGDIRNKDENRVLYADPAITTDVLQTETTGFPSVDISTLKYTDKEKENLVACPIFKVVPLGETMTGKTTLLQTLIAKRSSLTKLEERTEMAEVYRWTPDERPDYIYLLYDVGGQKSYQQTAYCFQTNSESTLNLLCHDLTKDDKYTDTMEWLKIIQNSAPNSQIAFLITKIDEMNDSEKKSKIKKLRENFGTLLKQEIDSSSRHYEECNSEEDKAMHQKHLENYTKVKDQIESESLLCVSCARNWEHTVADVIKMLLEFADKQRHLVMLRPIDKEVFIAIGKLGLKENMVLEPEKMIQKTPTEKADDDSGEITADGAIASASPVSPVATVSNVPVASAPGALQLNATDFNDEDDDDDCLSVTEIHPKLATGKSEKMRQQYMIMKEFHAVFKPIWQKYYPGKEVTDEELDKDKQECLYNLATRALIAYFHENNKLDGIIFNDISTLISILRCVFHHEIGSFLDFWKIKKDLRKKLYNDQKHFYDKDVDYMKKHGVLSSSIVEVFMVTSGCDIDADIVMPLLVSLNVAMVVEETNEDTAEKESAPKNKAFVPYFLESDTGKEIDAIKEKMCRSHGRVLSFRTILKGNIPRPFFHQLLVKIYGKMVDLHSSQKNNRSWRNGLFASLGQHEAVFIMHFQPNEGIEFIIQANVSDVEGHHILWEYVSFIDICSKDIKRAKFQGMPLEYYLTCTHCSGDDLHLADAAQWDIEEQLHRSTDCWNKASVPRTFQCVNSTKGFPRALVEPLPKDERKCEASLTELHAYMDHHFKEESDDTRSLRDLLLKDLFTKMDQVYKDTLQHVSLNAGVAASLELCLTDPTLHKHQELLEENMDPNDDLLDDLVVESVLTPSEKSTIEKDNSAGKTKRILLKVDGQGDKGVKLFVKVLQRSGDMNKNLAKVLEDDMSKI